MLSNWKSKPLRTLCVPRAQVTRVGDLPALDRGLARAERVAADGQHRLPALLNDRLRVGAVGLARFLIAAPTARALR